MDIFDILGSVVGGPVSSLSRNVKQSGGADNFLDSLLGKYAGTNLTGAEREANEFAASEAQKNRDFQERMSNTMYLRTVQDMKNAGLNPSVLLAGGAGTVSSPSGSTASQTSPSSSGDLLSAIMLPLQMKVLRAQARNIDADSDLKAEQAETQRTIQRLNGLTADWLPEMNEGQLSKWFAEVKQATSVSNLNVAQTDKVTSEAEAQKIINSYLDERQLAELNRVKSEKEHVDAQKRLSLAEAWFKEIQARYAYDNKVLMSNSDTLAMVIYFGHLLGLSTQNVKDFISKLPKSLAELGEKFPDAMSGLHD